MQRAHADRSDRHEPGLDFVARQASGGEAPERDADGEERVQARRSAFGLSEVCSPNGTSTICMNAPRNQTNPIPSIVIRSVRSGYTRAMPRPISVNGFSENAAARLGGRTGARCRG